MTTQHRTLRRSRHNRMVAGVCGGIADFLGISPFWPRLFFLISLIPGGVPGLALYALAWIVMPAD